ncbi:hypothetical protein OS493_036198 [Desmophyllum pertusum]|uniref:Uncharacterized protein n=1 Tax=Desmophyllum pertusum TaxID=174260 RepID=A0A9W9YUP7_9CNID|nr:hypothetical protein OS493_036198 [Desmophyllum pertusum]
MGGEDVFGKEDGRQSYICDEDAGTKLQIRKEKRTSEDANEKFTMKNNCEMKHEGDRRWNYNEDNGNATCLLSGHCKTKRAARKHNLCSEEEFECLRKRQKISISWDMESNETDPRESMKKLNCQVSMHPNVFGYHFQRPVLESRGKMEDPRKSKTDTMQDEHNIQVQHHNWISRCNPEIMEQSESCHMKGTPEMRGHIGDAIGDGQNSLLQIHDGVERTFKSAQRRSRKGTPFRRLRGDSTKCKEKDEMPAVEDIVINGFLSKRSPNNEEHDNWLLGNTSLEYRKLMTISEPEQKSLEEKRDNTRYHNATRKLTIETLLIKRRKSHQNPLMNAFQFTQR